MWRRTKTSSRPPGNGARRGVAGKLLGLLAASLTDGDGDPSRPGDRAALCRAAAFRPTQYPSGTGGCRS